MMSYNQLAWYNCIDPGFDYNTEESATGNRMDVAMNRVGFYEFFEEPIIDGILISRTLLEGKVNLIKENGYYHVSANSGKRIFPDIPAYCKTRGTDFITFADPGTWSYANYFELPESLYDTDDLIDYYSHMRYDLAGSVDWPIVDRIMQTVDGKRKFSELDEETKEHRRILTLELAEDFIKKCRKRGEINFMPFGTIQGYSTKTYRESLRKVLKMGYEYIAIGGLPAYSEERVVDLLNMIKDEIDRAGMRGIGMHMYGRFPAPDYTAHYLECYVSSFDNNSSFIYASKNDCAYVNPDYRYHGNVPIKPCCSVKIPMESGPMLSRVRRYHPESYESTLAHCKKSFRLFVKYVKTGEQKDMRNFLRAYTDLNFALEEVRRVKLKNEAKILRHVEIGRNALESKGWQRCGCTSCRTIRDHIYLSRGTNRTYHAFAHNTYVQYTRLQRELKKAKKNVSYNYDQTKLRKIHKLNNLERTAIKKDAR